MAATSTFTMRIDAGLKEQIQKRAEQMGMSASALVQLVMRGFISKPEIHVDLHHIQVKQMFADLDTRREENITEELRKELLDPAYLDHISQLAWDEFQQKTLS